MGPWPSMLSFLVRGDPESSLSLSLHRHIEEVMWAHIEKQAPRTRGGESHQKLTMLAPWSWNSSLQNWEKINFCSLNHSVYGILLWQPNQSNNICEVLWISKMLTAKYHIPSHNKPKKALLFFFQTEAQSNHITCSQTQLRGGRMG